MGEVYLAEDVRLHRPVALKTLRDDVQADEDARARLLREAVRSGGLPRPRRDRRRSLEVAGLAQRGSEGPS